MRRRLALEGLFERDLEVVAKVGAALAPAAAAASAPARLAEEVLEDVRHEVGEVGPEAGAAAAHALREGGMAETVVGGPLLPVRQHLIGFVELLEVDLGVLVARVAVRVIFHGELAEGGFQLRLVRALADAENLVIVAFGHRRPERSTLSRTGEVGSKHPG